jgi:glycosyltransferase Alg8
VNSNESNRDYRALVSGELGVDKPKKWHSKALLQVAAYIIICLLLLLLLPNKIWQPELKAVTITLGTLGIWRYSWWFVHVLRSEFYQRRRFPGIRANADKVWRDGWRPRHMHFMMTTFRERRETIELVIQSICRELEEAGVPCTLWLGSGDPSDEDIIINYLRQHARHLPLEFIIILQNLSGKRMGMRIDTNRNVLHGTAAVSRYKIFFLSRY